MTVDSFDVNSRQEIPKYLKPEFARMSTDASQNNNQYPSVSRHNWTREEVEALLALSLPELMFRAQVLHRQWFDPCAVQISTLLSIKSGGCPEDCGYCSQSVHHDAGIKASRLMPIEAVIAEARAAKAAGATRFCMGAAWRSPKEHDLDAVCAMITGVKSIGLETCVTLGMLDAVQARKLGAAGLEYYNHNLDTSPEHYGNIITTRTYQDRLNTLSHVQEAGISVCCGGIIGLGETSKDRAGLIASLACMRKHPESVPINLLVRVKGTALEYEAAVDPIAFVRVIATARITMPGSMIRLSAGRESMSDETQALCFLAGANSIFYGAKLLTAPNVDESTDVRLLAKLGLAPMRCSPRHLGVAAVSTNESSNRT